jgi:hypothetical protein
MTEVDLQDGMTADLTGEKILAQLDLLTRDEVFRSSKRSIAFLKYVVKETLNGSADQIKERTIGIEVFGRSSSYDTNLDHIVRTAATELRKRLAIYYGDEKHRSELRITPIRQARRLPKPACLPIRSLFRIGRSILPLNRLPIHFMKQASPQIAMRAGETSGVWRFCCVLRFWSPDV